MYRNIKLFSCLSSNTFVSGWSSSHRAGQPSYFRINVAAVVSRWQHWVWFDLQDILTSDHSFKRQTSYHSTNWSVAAAVFSLYFVCSLCGSSHRSSVFTDNPNGYQWPVPGWWYNWIFLRWWSHSWWIDNCYVRGWWSTNGCVVCNNDSRL